MFYCWLSTFSQKLNSINLVWLLQYLRLQMFRVWSGFLTKHPFPLRSLPFQMLSDMRAKTKAIFSKRNLFTHFHQTWCTWIVRSRQILNQKPFQLLCTPHTREVILQSNGPKNNRTLIIIQPPNGIFSLICYHSHTYPLLNPFPVRYQNAFPNTWKTTQHN